MGFATGSVITVVSVGPAYVNDWTDHLNQPKAAAKK